MMKTSFRNALYMLWRLGCDVCCERKGCIRVVLDFWAGALCGIIITNLAINYNGIFFVFVQTRLHGLRS